MDIRCLSCLSKQPESAFRVVLRGEEIYVRVCLTCRTPDAPRRSHPIVRYCPHGQPIRSSKRNALHLQSCVNCQKEYYSPKATDSIRQRRQQRARTAQTHDDPR